MEGIPHSPAGQIIGPALHQGGLDWNFQQIGQKWNVLEEDLFLEIDGVGGYHNPMSGIIPEIQQGWNQIGKCFSCPRSSLQHDGFALLQPRPNRLRGNQLLGPYLKRWQPGRNEAPRPQDAFQNGVFQDFRQGQGESIKIKTCQRMFKGSIGRR